jgi:hypothetical protein
MTQSHRPFGLYIWIPKQYRERVKAQGVTVNAPYSEFDLDHARHIPCSSCPVQAWAYAGGAIATGTEWDLYLVYSNHVPSWRKTADTKACHPSQYRIYEPIAPEHLHYIGTRSDDE